MIDLDLLNNYINCNYDEYYIYKPQVYNAIKDLIIDRRSLRPTISELKRRIASTQKLILSRRIKKLLDAVEMSLAFKEWDERVRDFRINFMEP